MEFFSNLTSKLSSAGKQAADKAKDLTGITKLNAKILAEENKMNKAYTEIGKLYYAACEGELAEEYAEQAAIVKAALEEIAAAKEQIKVLKGIRCCVECGKELGKNDVFCGSCGAKNELPVVEEAPVEEDRICEVCKSVVPADVVYCPTCGEKLAEQVEEAVEAVAEAVEEAVEEITE